MHQHPRLRTTYDSNSRYNPYQTGGEQDYLGRLPHRTDKLTDSGVSMASTSKQTDSGARRNRYQRSSTISVTQMLTDSCSSLLQRLTTRVRGPSQNADNRQNLLSTSASSSSVTHGSETSLLGSTRSRLEDKYSAVLERLAGKKRDPERTLEPSLSKTMEKRNALAKSATSVAIPENPLMKSATSVMLSEKQYPYVSAVSLREKTPYKSTHRLSQHNHYPEPPYAYLDQHSVYNIRHKTTNMPELRPRRSAKPMRTGKSSEEKQRTLKLCPVEIPCILDEPCSSHDDDKTPTNSDFVDPQIEEREARRKEIQSLIMKYSALDEAYNKATMNAAVNTVTSPVKVQQVAPVPPPHSVKIAHKYQPAVVALTVSNMTN